LNSGGIVSFYDQAVITGDLQVWLFLVAIALSASPVGDFWATEALLDRRCRNSGHYQHLDRVCTVTKIQQ
jgi:hypothetical protein